MAKTANQRIEGAFDRFRDLCPDFWRGGTERGTWLDRAFEDIALDLRLAVIHDGGHWLWGMRTYVHDPDWPHPSILPVVKGKIVGVDIPADEETLLALDPQIAVRRKQALSSAERRYWRRTKGQNEWGVEVPLDWRSPQSLPPYVSAQEILLEAVEQLSPSTKRRELAEKVWIEEIKLAERARYKNPWPGRDTSCSIFGGFDDPGYDVLMRVGQIFTGLQFPMITNAGVIATAEPRSHNSEVVEIDDNLWSTIFKVDLARGYLYLPVSIEPHEWCLAYSDIKIGKADPTCWPKMAAEARAQTQTKGVGTSPSGPMAESDGVRQKPGRKPGGIVLDSRVLETDIQALIDEGHLAKCKKAADVAAELIGRRPFYPKHGYSAASLARRVGPIWRKLKDG